jgi:integrase
MLRDHCRNLTPNAPLWPGISRYQAHERHQAACKAIDVEDYTLRDSRHSWAVRCRKRGGSLEEIAAQLGHRSILMAATVYAVFKPTLDERMQTFSAVS